VLEDAKAAAARARVDFYLNPCMMGYVYQMPTDMNYMLDGL
jgi:hypothetical protein